MKGPVVRRLCLAVIECYRRWVSPCLPPACRFEPTCSRYAWEAVHRHGMVIGLAKALGRLLRCHPFHPGGYDPVK